MADTRLVTIANELLTNVGNGLTAEGIPLPKRQYPHSGNIAFDLAGEDCAEAFVVAFQGLPQGTGPPDFAAVVPGTPLRCAVPLAATFLIVLLRCVPVLDASGKPPSAQALADTADRILIDSMTLPDVVVDLSLNGELFDSTCMLAGLGEVAAIGPEGGVGGVALTIFVSIAGMPK